jgi:hypothetical protein
MEKGRPHTRRPFAFSRKVYGYGREDRHMSHIFIATDTVVFRQPDDYLGHLRYELAEMVEMYGRGPFSIHEMRDARSIGEHAPPHPQHLLIVRDGKVIQRWFSGIWFNKLRL